MTPPPPHGSVDGGRHGPPPGDGASTAECRLDVLSIGEAMVTLLAAPGLPLTTALEYTRSVGGAEATVAIGVARLGLRAGWVSRVGADPYGEVIRRTMLTEGVELHLINDASRPTGLLIRDIPAVGAIQVQYHRAGSAASALETADLDEDLIRSARLLHLTGITAMLSDSAAEMATAAQRIARKAGRVTTFDPNVRRALGTPGQWSARVSPLATAADIVLSGLDELVSMTGTSDESEAVSRLLGAGVGVVVVKDGVRGSRGYTTQGAVAAPALPVTAVDPVGAGDAFAAGFLARILRAKPSLCAGDVLEQDELRLALQQGNAVAAAAVSVVGDLDGLPFAAQLEALLGRATPDVHR